MGSDVAWSPHEGTEWRVETVVSVTDGDTVRLRRSRVIELDGRTYRITDEDVRGVPIRLTWLDSPERGKPGYREAHDDLAAWIDSRQGLRVICFESGGWDRIMGDLVDADGESASQWMMREKGWLPYVKGQ